MRVMLRATLDTEKTNELRRNGKLSEMIQQTMDELKPEAAYFLPMGGRRTCLMVLDMADSSDLVPLGEPFLTDLGAEVEVLPIMNAEDLQRGLGKLH
ncbi:MULTISPECIES: hypothetical protein [unclassified Streptomyces]|uniref:hypothetical protein n=1 Tax=unclassified Streptomyces TaxID=2593676 RepID=UPI00365CD019